MARLVPAYAPGYGSAGATRRTDKPRLTEARKLIDPLPWFLYRKHKIVIMLVERRGDRTGLAS
jgi:hypothetical protein